MMIFSTKVTKAKLLTLALICCCIALVIIVSIPSGDTRTEAKTNNNTAKTNDDRVAFLKEYGWEIKNDPVEVVDVVIPTTFDSTYQSYNDLQKTQGFDLEQFKGKKATRYTYEITNYPTQQDSPVQANLLVIDSKVVAGDVTSVAMGGFMHSFERPAISQNNDDNKLNETSGPSASDVLDSLNESDK